MGWFGKLVLTLSLIQYTISVKVKVVMHSDQEDSQIEDEDVFRTESWDHKKKVTITMLPFLKTQKYTDAVDYEDYKLTTEKSKQLLPNELIFPLIYRQHHINSMFKFGENWYTWSTEKRNDGSKGTNYYICSEEPKHCDDVGWEHTDALPKCAFQIDSVLANDRACVNSFGVEPHTAGICDGAEQMKVNDIVRACGPRIRSLWRFVRVGRRPVNAAKPADVNSLICEDEEECYITIEYRIHHDRITFSLHEPTRGQTFKSILKRELSTEEDKGTPVTENQLRFPHKNKKARDETINKNHIRSKAKVEGKGIIKDGNESVYANRRVKNKIKIRDDISEDLSE